MFLRSGKKLKSDLQGTWERTFLGVEPYFNCGIDSFFYKEQWTFKDDNLVTAFVYFAPVTCNKGYVDLNNNDLIDTSIISKFKVDANLSRAFLKLQLVDKGFDSTVFVDKWEFVTLDNNTLYIATDDPNGGSVLQREFYKVK